MTKNKLNKMELIRTVGVIIMVPVQVTTMIVVLLHTLGYIGVS